ncbi:MAG TPA: hypothetical protein VI790_06365 [Candidatus Nanoarchaeia archaeon]|nr:hypothetical protein [Candidatus Nanoarchaeia archaeon]
MISIKSLPSFYKKADNIKTCEYPVNIGDFTIKNATFNNGSLATESEILNNDCQDNYLILNISNGPDVNLLIHYYPSEETSAIRILTSYVGKSLGDLVLKGGKKISKIKSRAFIRYENGPIDLVCETNDFKLKKP